MTIQTRNNDGEILTHESFRKALKHAREDRSVWKISFNLEDGTHIRLIKTKEGWTYESIDGDRL